MPTEHKVISYKFAELSDRAKDVARDWFRQGGLDYDWWESTYEDAARVGLKITGFDLGRGPQCVDGNFADVEAVDVARAILKDHGPTCATYALAEAFLDGIEGEPTDEQTQEFLRDIRAEYWCILNREAEYINSDEQVDESIEANEYDFDASGHRFRY